MLGLVGFAFSFYHWIFEADLTQRAGELTAFDFVIGTVTIVLVFDAARRMMGWALPFICTLFLAYALLGQADLRPPREALDEVMESFR